MIEWKECEVMRGAQFPKDKKFLVTNGKWVGVALHYHEYKIGYQWWDEQGFLLNGITHYAEFNLPEPKRGGLVNPDGGNYPLKWMSQPTKEE